MIYIILNIYTKSIKSPYKQYDLDFEKKVGNAIIVV